MHPAVRPSLALPFPWDGVPGSSRARASFRALACGVLLGGALARSASAGTAPVTPTFYQSSGSAMLTFPSGVAADADGNLYVTDSNNNRVARFDVLGHFVTQWGSLGSGNGQFSNPTGIALDRNGNVYVSDQNNNRVEKFAADGTFLAKWGTAGAGPGQFNNPAGLAVDRLGNVFVADYANNRVQKFTSTGTYVSQWGVSGAGNGEFSFPTGVMSDTSGNVYVADYLNHRVQKFTGAGAYLAQWGSNGTGNGQFQFPYGLARDAFGNVYVSESVGDRVQKFTADGTYVTQWGAAGAGDGSFNFPRGLAVDPAGNVYVADANNNRLQRFSGAGLPAVVAPPPAWTLTWGSNGAGDGQFSTVWGITADADGYLWVADQLNYRVEKFTGNGAFVLKFGSPGTGPGQLNTPFGVATDSQRNVYVTSLDGRVEKFTSSGTFLLQWGSAGSASGQFNGPQGIAVDASGFVYVADTFNQRVQKFTSSGGFVSQWGSSGSSPGQFTNPWAVAVDAAGYVYVSDAGDRIQKFTSTGTFVTQFNAATGGSTASGIAVDRFGDVYVADHNAHTVQKFRPDGTPLALFGSAGSGPGQFNVAMSVAVDPAGNVFVSDYNHSRMEKFVNAPTVALVSDVGNDQGRQARLRIYRASLDAANDGGVTGYAVYRRVETLPGAGSAAPASVSLAGWDFVGTQPAAGDAEYSMVVPTLADANAGSVYYTSYLVRALTADPLTHYDSVAEAGYSIDNLAPPAPAPFAAAFVASATHLHWSASGAPDFAAFRLYRGADAAFVPGPASLLTTTTDTSYVDSGPPGSTYKLSAMDWNGNESPFSTASAGPVTDVGPGAPAAFALGGARPNPVTGRELSVTFSLPAAGAARLELLDVMGRSVLARDVGGLGAGAHVIALSAGHRLAPGVYLLRLSRAGEARVARVIVIE